MVCGSHTSLENIQSILPILYVLQVVCITYIILVFIYSLGAFPNTLLGGMCSHTCSLPALTDLHTLAGMTTL